jgi:hypothetical protein
VAGPAAGEAQGQLARVLHDTDRITLAGTDAQRATILLVVRLHPDAPEWAPMVADLPGYAARQAGDHTIRQWRTGAESTLYAAQHERTVYLCRDANRLDQALAVAAEPGQMLAPDRRFPDWPKTLTGVLLVVAAVDMQDFRAPDRSPGLRDLRALVLTVVRADDHLALHGRLTAVDSDKSQQLLDVMQGSVSLGILSESLPLPLRECLKSLRLTRAEALITIDGVWTLEQVGNAWRAYAADSRATTEATP